MFKKEDVAEIEKRGLSVELVENQIKHFEQGFPFVNLDRPASLNDGIESFTTQGAKKLFSDYDEQISGRKIMKFVPSSGAATRMFKDLFYFQENFTSSSDINDDKLQFGFNFFKHLHQFAFYEDLRKIMHKDGLKIEKLLEEKQYSLILDYILSEKGLNYANLPKALILFHKYDEYNRTALQEHMVEGALYAKLTDNTVKIHFTVSPEHQAGFETLVKKIKSVYEKKFNVKFDINFSNQKSETDTIAVDLKNKPFKDKEGKLAFRPAGHGALLSNLNDLDADVVFIKNIDNVVPDRIKETTVLYKKVIASYLMGIQDKSFHYLKLLNDSKIKDKTIKEIELFVKDDLLMPFPKNYSDLETEAKIALLIELMNRPMRVCGMVKNEGEPGGGPFWVKDTKLGVARLQIVETSQIDLQNNKQKRIMEQSTHFNPVDLVCSLKNFRGEKFNLFDFVNPDTGFISQKSKDGRDLKALELPGLWNGAMDKWITIFVEVPLITFNPVKTINDLIRNEHIS